LRIRGERREREREKALVVSSPASLVMVAQREVGQVYMAYPTTSPSSPPAPAALDAM
jgi:hypothetical protein